jgi:hypothetical protein
MTIPGNVIRFVFSANNLGGEVINTGWWAFLNTAAPTQTDINTLTSDAAGVWNTFSLAMEPYFYTGVSWKQVQSYYYDGGSNNAALQGVANLTANAGTQAGTGTPIDTCVVASLRTGFPGRDKRGRMYLPYHKAVLNATGQMSSTDAGLIVAACGNMFNSWSSAHPGWAAVVSRTSSSSRAITQVLVDTKPDVQRRRENKLVATATQSVTVTP